MSDKSATINATDLLRPHIRITGLVQRVFRSKKTNTPYVNLYGLGGTAMIELMNLNPALAVNENDRISIQGFGEFGFDGKLTLRKGEIVECNPSPLSPNQAHQPKPPTGATTAAGSGRA